MSKSQREASTHEPPAGEEVSYFMNSLVPSFLRIYTQERVIRLDTFSKTIAPGVRLGWFTCSPLFAERLERIGEMSTHNPCGLSQALVMALPTQWTFAGCVACARSTSSGVTFSWTVLRGNSSFFQPRATQCCYVRTRTGAVVGSRWMRRGLCDRCRRSCPVVRHVRLGDDVLWGRPK